KSRVGPPRRTPRGRCGRLGRRPGPHAGRACARRSAARAGGAGWAFGVTLAGLVTATALFPAFALDVLHRPGLLGLLYSAGVVGSLAATVTSGWTAKVRRQGRAIVLAAVAWGAAVALAAAPRRSGWCCSTHTAAGSRAH